ncbi:MAG: SCO family protein [Pyrinomonadaceae bacterium]|nr:SCO family protein [Pyrinomonadaceae bacterium]MCX7639329.1 SCO family protein [Pyrinomonadaceae bacterium]MDW8303443.1 SCO family protein [Acidobacteriota bacterium]
MKKVLNLLVLILAFTAACKDQKDRNHGSHDVGNSSEVKRYELRGRVISVDKEKKKAEIEHEEIPGFMPKMTMSFPIREDWVWEDLVPGVEIKADLVVDEKAKEPYWLENVMIIATKLDDLPNPPVKEGTATIGTKMPDFQLVNQDGKKISMKDFLGKAFAITFIYSRCPLSDYCIRMSINFSDLNKKLINSQYRDRIRLLTVSFDPAHDTPEKLKQYGIGYMGKDANPDFTVWQLAVGKEQEVKKLTDFFGLRYEIDANDKTQFNHSLRTAVITPDGRVKRVFTGNDWTVDELERELISALQ